MVLRLPYGMTVAEYSDLKRAYDEGYFMPGETAQSKPLKTKNLSDIAAEAGKSEAVFSRTLSNAKRKIIDCVANNIFPRGNLWERQANESSHSYTAFCIYMEFGLLARSTEKVAQKLSGSMKESRKAYNKKLKKIKEWRNKNNWDERVRAWDLEQYKKALQGKGMNG